MVFGITARNPLRIEEYYIKEPAGFVWLMNELIPLEKVVGVHGKEWIKDVQAISGIPHPDGSITFDFSCSIPVVVQEVGGINT